MGFQLRTRLAPTPSGYLHLGNAWSFVLTWLAARSQGGHIHLRIDDLDTARAQPEYLENVFSSLQWLGLDWDSGPRNAAEFRAAHSQRNRLSRYQDVMSEAMERKLVFACACSRETVRRNAESSGRPNLYPGTCRELALDPESSAHSWRCRVGGAVKARNETGQALEFQPGDLMGDFIVRQKNGDPSYQMASVVDDEDMRINFVVRGLDLLPSTAAQLCLAHGLEFGNFTQARFWHHALVLDDAGVKLSKSAQAESIKSLRAKYPDPVPILKFFGKRMGFESDVVFSVSDLLPGFATARVATIPWKLSDFWREIQS